MANITFYYKTKEYLDCKTEQPFKIKYIANNFRKLKHTKTFCIETEETVAGFPDVMTLTDGREAKFYEFKCSDSLGKIKFQPTQPSFYKRNAEMEVTVVAYNRKSQIVHLFSASEIFKKESKYKINLKAEINLCNAEV